MTSEATQLVQYANLYMCGLVTHGLFDIETSKLCHVMFHTQDPNKPRVYFSYPITFFSGWSLRFNLRWHCCAVCGGV